MARSLFLELALRHEELPKALAALDANPEVKVIVLTGQNDQANALRAVSLGAYDFLAKPFEPDVLNLTVERACRLAELQAENRRQEEHIELIASDDASIVPTVNQSLVLQQGKVGFELVAESLIFVAVGEENTCHLVP